MPAAGEPAAAFDALRSAYNAALEQLGNDALVLVVPCATAAVVNALASGCALGEAAASTLLIEAAVPFDLASSLALLIRHGALIAWSDPGVDA